MEIGEFFKNLEIIEEEENEHENDTDVSELFSQRALEDSLDFEAGVEELPL